MVVQHGGPLVEPTGVPGIAESEPVEIQMMTELMAQCAQERPKRRYLLAYGRSLPDANHQGIRVVIAEQLSYRPLADPQRSRREHSDATFWDAVEVRCVSKKFHAGALNVCRHASLHGGLDAACACLEPVVGRYREGVSPIAVEKRGKIPFPRWSVREHSAFILSDDRCLAHGDGETGRLGDADGSIAGVVDDVVVQAM